MDNNLFILSYFIKCGTGWYFMIKLLLLHSQKIEYGFYNYY